MIVEIDYKGVELQVYGHYVPFCANDWSEGGAPGTEEDFEISDIKHRYVTIKSLFDEDDECEIRDLVLDTFKR